MISVIIPTYNNAQHVIFAIESIQNQTYENIEIIVVDDFSTDDTKEIVKQYVKEDTRIKYFLNDYNDPNRYDSNGININAGYSARNFGLKKARGEWITFQDADDFSFLNRLEIQLALAEKYNIKHLTTSVIWLKDEYFLKKINNDEYQQKEKMTIVSEQEIYEYARAGIGLFAKVLPNNIWSKFPFTIKRKLYINNLFFGHLKPYPGGANSTFFKKELIEKVKFRKRDERIWPSLRGRGADRDFNYNLAYTFRDSIFVNIPLYCWRTPKEFKNDYDLDNITY